MLRLITYLSAILALVPFVRPDDRARAVLLWPLKLFSGAATPILGLICGLGALLGLVRRDWRLAGAGALGLGLVARFWRDVTNSRSQSGAASGSGWPSRRAAVGGPYLATDLKPHPDAGQTALHPGHSRLAQWASQARASNSTALHPNVAVGPDQMDLAPSAGFGTGSRWLGQRRPEQAGQYLADIWEPGSDAPRSGLGVVYVHGGGWRIGDKDMGTRPFFRRLAAQGHVVMDISYPLWPEADIPTMVGRVKRAVLWLKEHSSAYELDPERLVLVGGSAGAHLALLAAYTAGRTTLPPDGLTGDSSVRGVVAFYPPIDLLDLWEQKQAIFGRQASTGAQGLVERAAERMLDWTFALPDPELDQQLRFRSFLPALLGGEPHTHFETYRLLSPASHVGPHCPPTLLLQGHDDVFLLAPAVRQLHQELQAAGVTSILVEYPHAEHAFDLVLPQISPLAQAATFEVEQFLGSLA